MPDPAKPLIDEPCFQIDGEIIEVLKGCGMAIVKDSEQEDLTINKGTHGVHFDQIEVGQKVSCDISVVSKRVVHVHQQTQPMFIQPGAEFPCEHPARHKR